MENLKTFLCAAFSCVTNVIRRRMMNWLRRICCRFENSLTGKMLKQEQSCIDIAIIERFHWLFPLMKTFPAISSLSLRGKNKAWLLSIKTVSFIVRADNSEGWTKVKSRLFFLLLGNERIIKSSLQSGTRQIIIIRELLLRDNKAGIYFFHCLFCHGTRSRWWMNGAERKIARAG